MTQPAVTISGAWFLQTAQPVLAETPPPPAEAGPGELSAHEALLLRHGLISHRAEIAGQGDAAEGFLRDVSRIAANVIRLSDNCYGLLLPASCHAPISDRPHRLVPLGKSADRQQAAETAPPVPPAEGDAVPSAIADRNAVATLSDGIARLSGQLDAQNPSALAEHLAPFIELAIDRRLAPAESAHLQSLKDQQAWRDEAARFWEGMEAILRVLSETSARLSSAATILSEAPRSVDAEDLTLALQRLSSNLEEALSRGVAATTASIADAQQKLGQGVSQATAPLSEDLTALRAGMSALSDRVGALAASVDALREHAPGNDGLPALAGRFDTLEERLGEVGQRVAAHEAGLSSLQAHTDTLSDGLAALTSDTREHAALAQALLEAVASDIGRLHQSSASESPGTDASMERIEEALARLSALMDEAPASKLETLLRSSQNFWKANEDALLRLAGMLEAIDARDGETRALGAAILDGVTRLEAVLHGAIEG